MVFFWKAGGGNWLLFKSSVSEWFSIHSTISEYRSKSVKHIIQIWIKKNRLEHKNPIYFWRIIRYRIVMLLPCVYKQTYPHEKHNSMRLILYLALCYYMLYMQHIYAYIQLKQKHQNNKTARFIFFFRFQDTGNWGGWF